MNHQTWRSQNPLRRWREPRGLSQGVVALMLIPQVSRQSVANWEQGVSDPDQNWDALARLMRTSGRRLRVKWVEWRAACPR